MAAPKSSLDDFSYSYVLKCPAASHTRADWPWRGPCKKKRNRFKESAASLSSSKFNGLDGQAGLLAQHGVIHLDHQLMQFGLHAVQLAGKVVFGSQVVHLMWVA